MNFNLAALLQDQARAQQRIAHLKSRHPVFALYPYPGSAGSLNVLALGFA
jgi:hypothetical protein